MKTVIDAVNELKADVLNIQNYNNALINIRFNEDYEAEYIGFFMSKLDKQPFSSFICTVGEFNACVGELSVATWINGISIEEWKAGMKNTVIDSHGNELEIGKIYEFSDDGVKWFSGTFSEFSQNHKRKYVDDTESYWTFIRECQSPLGTIKKAPVKLVNGKAYQFEDIEAGKIWVGFYDAKHDRFNIGGDGSACFIGGISNFKNIIPLVPEIK